LSALRCRETRLLGTSVSPTDVDLDAFSKQHSNAPSTAATRATNPQPPHPPKLGRLAAAPCVPIASEAEAHTRWHDLERRARCSADPGAGSTLSRTYLSKPR
jgi:hypothetical protein